MITLTEPLVTWLAIVIGVIVFVVVRVSSRNYCSLSHEHKLIELGSEREEFFVPGDRAPRQRGRHYDRTLKDDECYDEDDY